MSQREKTDQDFIKATTEYKITFGIFTRVQELYARFGQATSEIRAPTPNSRGDVPGFPGTLFDCAEKAVAALDDIHGHYKSFSDFIASEEILNLNGILSERIRNKETEEMKVSEIEEKDKVLVSNTFSLHSNLLDSTNKINDFVHAKSAKSAAVPKRVLTNMWQSYSKCLADYLPEREALKLSTDEMELATSNYINAVNNYEKEVKANVCQTVLRSYMFKIGLLVHSLQKTSNELVESCSKINFESDFKDYTVKANFKTFDIEYPKFKRFQFSSRFTMPDKTYIQRFKLNYFPVLAGVAKADFKSDSQNEIVLKKGKRIYLMERPTENMNWILSLCGGWAQFGFVPFSHVEVIDKRIGCIKKSFIQNESNNSKLNFVIILEEDDKTYTCEDELFNRIKIPKEEIYLL